MFNKLKPLLLGAVVTSFLTGCGIGQMKDDLAELREYQRTHGQALEQQRQYQQQAEMRKAQQASQAAQKRLDKAIEKH